MFVFKYSEKFDKENWERLIRNGIKFGHEFHGAYCVSKLDIKKAFEKAVEFEIIWKKYQDVFRAGMRKIFNKDFPGYVKFFINTSNYSSFNPDKSWISISMNTPSNRVVPTILHEANHFMFRKYYNDFCYSVGCTKEDMDRIKEFLTIINNEVFSPMEDGSWDCYAQQRELTLIKWKECGDIKKVIKDIK
ncbi:MAG: hypothetical protein PHW73_14965 [Atribacterota bacterium]|nr:hypothetical protein [Atribacterota bacterium]